MKNLISLMFVLTIGGLAQAQNVSIPDANLKAALIALNPTVDTSGDGEIQVSEAAAYTGTLNLFNKGIADATGLEAFVNATLMQIASNSLTTLDISQNTKLERLFCASNSLNSITLGTAPLTGLSFSNNNLSVLNLSHLSSSLEFLQYAGNPLSATFDFTPFTNLTFLYVDDAGLTSLDVSMLPKLEALRFSNNNLSELNVSANPALYTLFGIGNPSLTCIQVADPTYNWEAYATVDEGVFFTDDCADPLVVIPDANLKSALLTHAPDIDTNDDGDIRQSEASAFTGTLSLNSRGIKDAKGLEAFDAAVGFLLQGNVIQRLNVSTNVALTNLDVSNNELKFLNVRNGNQANFTSFNATGNVDLSCINVDDVTTATSTWTSKPAGASYSTDCIVNIPDANFKTALTTHSPAIDINTDGQIQESEAAAFTETLTVASKSISSLAGIGAFYKAKSISCGTNTISTPDFSLNTNMTQLIANNAGFNTLDVSANKALNYLSASGNNLNSLNLNGNPYVRTIFVSQNNLSTISIANEEIVTRMDISSNQFSDELDLTSFTSLSSFQTNLNSGLTSINASGLERLESISCYNSGLTSIDLSGALALTAISIGRNSVESLDVSDSPLLRSLNVANNELATLDVSDNPLLTTLYANSNQLVTLDVNNGANLSTLSVHDNPNLSCISVFDEAYAEANFSVSFSYTEDCGNLSLDFLDPKMEEALLSHSPSIDANGNGKIQELEVADFSGALNLADAGIRNASGIELFVNATSINLDNNHILSLNLNGNAALTSLSAINNDMTILQIKNGNNANFTSVNLAGNDGLTCINVDDPTYATNNWTGTPAGVSYSTDCIVNFPDANFKTRLIFAGYDLDADGEIQLSEAETVTGTLSAQSSSLSSISGIEAFTNMTGIVLNANTLLSAVNFTANTALQFLEAETSFFNHLDLSLNPNMTSIDMYKNRLLTIDVRNGNNQNITTFNIGRSGGSTIGSVTCVNVDDVAFFESNFSGGVDDGVVFDTDCSDLFVDIPDANFLAAILSHSPAIDLNADGIIRESEAVAFGGMLDVSSEGIADLTGIAYFSNMIGLNVDDNQLTTLDLSLNEALTSFSADNNDLVSLNVANRNNEEISMFSITGNTSLSCVRVDDPAYSTANWTDHDGVTFGNYCDLSEFVYMPDAFLYFILRNSDLNIDQKITFGEAQAFTAAVTVHPNVEDLTGLEAFINLEGISYSGTLISHFDVSKNTGLKSFVIGTQAEVTSIDLGQNILLETLSLSGLDQSALDLSGFTALEQLFLVNCNLSNLTLTDASMLTRLTVRDNALTSLDISGNPLLEHLSVSNNPLTALDLTNNTSLTDIDISRTDITTIDVSHLVDLEDFRVESGSLTTLDVSQNAKLNLLYASEYDSEGAEDEPETYGALTQVLLPAGSILRDIDLSANQIQSIDIPALTNASLRIHLEWNGLKTISMAGVTGNNVEITLDNNEIETINVAAVTGTGANVSVKNNQLEQALLGAVNGIDLTGNPNLTCAQTTDIAYAEANYLYDNVSFSTDICATPTDLVFSSTSFDENSASAVGTFTTTDESVNDVHEYTFFEDGSETSNALFEIIDDELFPKTAFNFENEDDPIYLVQVQSDDGFGGIITKQFIIALKDINEGPTNLTLDNLSIDESNPAGTVIGILSTEDVDQGDIHTYTVVDGCTVCRTNESSYFTIVGNELRSSVIFDFETISSYGIDVTTTDAGGNTWTDGYIITINDLPASVTAVTLDVSTINENEPASTLVGTLSTTGEDLSGSYTYGLVTGTGDDDNALFTISGEELIANESFNYEVKNSYSILVMTDDGNGHTLNQQLTILVGDVSESTDTHILTFVLAEQTGEATIDANNHTVAIEVANGTDVTSLTPTVTLSAGATISPEGAQDFTGPVTYTVTAEDGTTTQDWVVTVTAEPAEVTAIDDNDYKLSIYPNPTSDWLTIVSPYTSTSDIQLFDLGGGLMFSQKLNKEVKISLQDLETGLYLLKFTNDDITTTTKILIRR